MSHTTAKTLQQLIGACLETPGTFVDRKFSSEMPDYVIKAALDSEVSSTRDKTLIFHEP